VAGQLALRQARHKPFAPASLPRSVPAVKSDGELAAGFSPDTRDKVVATARQLVGRSNAGNDCTGFIATVFRRAGVDLIGRAHVGENGVTGLYRFATEHGRVYSGGWPVPGDLVFFRETYDVNRDGRTDNDGLTHVGLVDSVDADGTVEVIHRVSRGVVRYRMNLKRPDLHADPRTGQTLNDYLKTPGPGHREVLTGQLFWAYATILPNGPQPPVATAQR
jgi:peptidoglycan DL-endopeptidase CwlO